MERDEFSDVQWQSTSTPHDNTDGTFEGNEPLGAAGEARESNAERVASAESHPGHNECDYGGVGSGMLECTVSKPHKEGEGGKDSYVSYLVTTHVRTC